MLEKDDIYRLIERAEQYEATLREKQQLNKDLSYYAELAETNDKARAERYAEGTVLVYQKRLSNLGNVTDFLNTYAEKGGKNDSLYECLQYMAAECWGMGDLIDEDFKKIDAHKDNVDESEAGAIIQEMRNIRSYFDEEEQEWRKAASKALSE